MNTARRIVLIFSVLLSMLMQEVRANPANPNHLEPVCPYDMLDINGTRDSYKQAVFTSLIGKGWLPDIWMIERPSSSREYAVIIRARHEHDPNDPRPSESKPKRWVVDYVALKEKTWMWEEVGGDAVYPGASPTKTIRGNRLVPHMRPTKDVERHRIEVTEESAKVVYGAWLSTLQLTRYAEERGRGLDGTTLEFYCDGLFGQTWSPEAGLPAKLADLGRKLGMLAQSAEKDREHLLAEAESLAGQITREAEAEQLKLFGKKMSRGKDRERILK